MKNDGNIRIGIKITDTDRQIKNVEGKIELLNNKLETMGKNKLPLQNKLKQIEQQMLDNEAEYKRFQEMVSDGKLSASEFKALGGTEGIEKNLLSLENANDRLNAKADMLQQNINKITDKEKETNIKLSEQERLREELIQKQQKLNIAQIGSGKDLDGINNKISMITRKVVRWGLAVFSIRSAYTFVRQAMSTLTQYNQQMSTDIEYIRYALANMIKPIIEWIINAVYKILTYINYIANAWFGVNLFKNAGADKFASDMSSASNSAKEIKKELAGFDVANVMSEQSSSSSKSKATGVPSLDLSQVKQIDVPDWVKWIADHKDLIIGLASLVGIAFGASKVASVLSGISKIFGVAGATGKIAGSGLLGLGTSLASIVAIAGAIAIIAYVAKSTWDDLKKLGNEVDEISEKIAEQNKEWKKSLDPVKDLGNLVNTVSVNIQGGRDNLKNANSWWAKATGTADKYLNVARRVAENSKETVDKAKEMLEYEGRTKEEKQQILDMLKQQYEYNLDVISALDTQGQDTTKLRDITQEYSNIIYKTKQDIDGTNSKVEEMSGNFKESKTFIERVKDRLNDINNQKMQDKSFDINVNANTKNADNKVSDLLQKAAGVYSILNPGKSVISQISTVAKSVKSLFHLDGGGLVLPVPGHGVPVGANAIMSERRAEAIIPFENPEAMRKIGKEIGQWVNIAIQNEMVVDGRVLASATNNRNSKQDFLMNR